MDTTTVAQRTGWARPAGIVGLVGGLVAVGVGAYELSTLPLEVSTTSGLRNALLHVATIVALAGLAALGAVGTAWWGRLGLGLTILGFVALTVAEVLEPVDPVTAMAIFELAPLVIGPGLVLAGAAVLHARRWSGWRRVVPLAVGAYVLAVFLPVMIAIGTDAAFWTVFIGFELGLAALGLAVAQEASAGSRAT
ncbi:hypothetical protein [Actinomycetospora flava]|uniref:DUF998 domain-containing protein n=1 Tax=Actinomycetospora flava TaxID=3129232 RepID=A0ABU8M8M1_9PSEU